MGAEFRTVEPARVPTPTRVTAVEPEVVATTARAQASAAPANVSAMSVPSAGPLDEAIGADLGSDPVAEAQSALGALAMGFAVSAPTPAGAADNSSTGRKSLDDAIVEMLRPMLRDWLDSHLPDMVEKALRQEMSANHDRLGG